MAAVAEPLLTPRFLAQLEQLELVSRKVFRGRMRGDRRSTRKGQSVEFADFRSYVPGDDLRFIDWNTYARLDRLFLKLFVEEEDLRFFVLLDTSLSMDFGTPSKLRVARQLAAALGFVALIRADRVRIETLALPAREGAPVWRGRHQAWRMFDHIANLPLTSATELAEGVKRFCLRNTGAGVVVLISDLLDKRGYADALRYLVARQMDVFVIQVLAPEDLDPDVTGDLRLVDCEDGDAAEVTVTAGLLRRYQQNVADFVSGARAYCTRRGISYLMTSSGTPVDQLVTSYLRQRGLVR